MGDDCHLANPDQCLMVFILQITFSQSIELHNFFIKKLAASLKRVVITDNRLKILCCLYRCKN